MNNVFTVLHKDEHTRLFEHPLAFYLSSAVFSLVHEALSFDPDSPSLESAILSGRLSYHDGYFVGPLEAAISKELRSVGAQFVDGRFYLPPQDLPMWLRSLIARGKSHADEQYALLILLLANALENIEIAPTGIPHEAIAKAVQHDLGQQWGNEDTELALDEYVARAEEWSKKLSRNFTEDLLEKTQTAQAEGVSPFQLKALLESEHTRVKRSAHFVAEHEMAKFISEYRKFRARGIGSPGYIWNTQRDERVRQDHFCLDRKTFSWSEPPVTNHATGARNHPGEDYGCRCYPQILAPAASRMRVDKVK